MSRVEFYRRLYKKMWKIILFFLLVGVCTVLFFATKRTKEPKVSFNLLDYPSNLQVESILCETLDKSFVLRERLENAIPLPVNSDAKELVRIKYYPRYRPLLDPRSNVPLEAYLSLGDAEIAFKEVGLNERADISWNFVMDKKNLVAHFSTTEMNVNGIPGVWMDEKNQVFFLGNATIRKLIDVPEGLMEFTVTAANISVGVPTPDYDPSPHMVVHIDGQVIGDVYVTDRALAQYNFTYSGSAGWKTFDIVFDNDLNEPTNNRDRNLWVKEVSLNELLGAVYVNAKKELKERYFPGNYIFSYFRSLPQDEANNLIRFFKSRFQVDDLRDVVRKGYPVWALMKEIEISSLTKQAIFAPSPTKIKMTLKVPMGGTRLAFGYGIMEEAWDKPGDGVEFKVRVEGVTNESEGVLFARYINPKVNRADRRWFHDTIDLRRYAGKTITLVFETIGSAAKEFKPALDTAYDYALWTS